MHTTKSIHSFMPSTSPWKVTTLSLVVGKFSPLLLTFTLTPVFSFSSRICSPGEDRALEHCSMYCSIGCIHTLNIQLFYKKAWAWKLIKEIIIIHVSPPEPMTAPAHQKGHNILTTGPVLRLAEGLPSSSAAGLFLVPSSDMTCVVWLEGLQKTAQVG